MHIQLHVGVDLNIFRLASYQKILSLCTLSHTRARELNTERVAWRLRRQPREEAGEARQGEVQPQPRGAASTSQRWGQGSQERGPQFLKMKSHLSYPFRWTERLTHVRKFEGVKSMQKGNFPGWLGAQVYRRQLCCVPAWGLGQATYWPGPQQLPSYGRNDRIYLPQFLEGVKFCKGLRAAPGMCHLLNKAKKLSNGIKINSVLNTVTQEGERLVLWRLKDMERHPMFLDWKN